MSDGTDIRLIEDYLPIEAISAEASREKSVRKGHISTLHLWWARRPLVACRAAVYGALVPADRWVKDVNLKNPPEDAEKATKAKNGKKKGLNRKAAKEFVTKLCRYPKTNPTKEADVRVKRETEAAIVDAQRHILEAHADRLTAELAEALKLPSPACGRGAGGEGWAEGAPGWLNEFHWPRDKTVATYDDIVAGRAPRPRVLDMFAGGGAIPLEALRLGCEAYALDLNPVAHIIQLCTLVYPQKYGKPDPTARGMTGPPLRSARVSDPAETADRRSPRPADEEETCGQPSGSVGDRPQQRSWGGLAAEVRYWGNWVLDRVRKEIGDLYPPIPDPEVWSTPPEIEFDRETGAWNVLKEGTLKRGVRLDALAVPRSLLPDDGDDDSKSEIANRKSQIPPGFLQPVAYLWTRTVRCKNPSCAATVPLVKQTWLCKKPARYAALNMIATKNKKVVDFNVEESNTETGLEFDPKGFSTGGNATCPFCGTVADSEYVKAEGCEGRIGEQLMSVVGLRPGRSGKVYLSPGKVASAVATPAMLAARLSGLAHEHGLCAPSEPMPSRGTLGFRIQAYGITSWGQLFTPRQAVTLLTMAKETQAVASLVSEHNDEDASKAIGSILAMVIDRVAAFSSRQCTWNFTGGRGVKYTFQMHILPMVWDFAEGYPFNPEGASWESTVDDLGTAIDSAAVTRAGTVIRGSAMKLPLPDATLDAVVSDPPYYDNVPYADLSDFFYVWLKRTIGHQYPEHFASELTPKMSEAIAEPARHKGVRRAAMEFYEGAMAAAFGESNRVLKPEGSLAIVYAHKTTLGWATLVDALRRAHFMVTEAWPFDTERPGRLRAQESSALASSIFLVARKRSRFTGVGNYEDDVQPDLQQIVRERVETLWEMGIAGADLVIACVGAGLRAFTKYEKVEYANGEEVPAEKFLAEVEGVVLDTMMGKLMSPHPGPLPKGEGVKVSAIDPGSRFYILWRFVYKATEIDAGEAIVFTYAQHVELDGPLGLSTGKAALVEKKKAKYRARDFTERGDNDKLGLPSDHGQSAPLIDVLHRVLWLMENSPRKLSEFLIEADPDRERLRLLAQALAGAALAGKSEEDAEKLVGTTAAERSALGKLLANWKAVVENAVVTKGERADQKRGQTRLFE